MNPVEGTLLWTIGPKDTRRRTEQGFPGAANMLTAEGKPKKFGRKRVGFMGHTKPARPGADIYSADGTTKVGTVTSGTVSPCLNAPIAMGYVETALGKNGTELTSTTRARRLRGKSLQLMHFVEPVPPRARADAWHDIAVSGAPRARCREGKTTLGRASNHNDGRSLPVDAVDPGEARAFQLREGRRRPQRGRRPAGASLVH